MRRKKDIKIRVMMVRKGITGGDIARSLEPPVTRTAVNSVIKGRWKSVRVRTAIAEALGVPYEKLWGKKEKEAA